LSRGGQFSERAVILAPNGRDGEIAAKLLREGGFFAVVHQDIPSLCSELAKGAAIAIVADEAIRTADVRPLTELLSQQEPWSDLPILLLTRAGGGPERNPAARRFSELLGNVTFLERPFHPTTLVTMARSALRARKRQYETRSVLENVRATAARRARLMELDDILRDLDDPAEITFAAAEQLGRWLNVSRAGYGFVDKRAETITIERDWNAPGINSLAGVLRFRDYGSYIDDLKRGETVTVADARTDPRTAETSDALEAINATALVNMPITEKGDLVALLYLNNATPREWPEEVLTFIREVAERTRSVEARRQAEVDLKALAASLEILVQDRTAALDRAWRNSSDLQVIVDPSGVFKSVSPASLAILGYQPADMIGHNLLEFIWPDDVETTEAILGDAERDNLTSFENRYRHRDGSPRWISWNTTPGEDEVYGYGRDVTETKLQQKALAQTEEQLRQAQKMEAVGQLTGGLAHDFNNLLAAITGSLEMLENRVLQGRFGDYERYIASAKSSAKRAAALTHRLLAFSRRQTLDPKPVNLNRLVNGMGDLIQRTVGPQIEMEVVGAAGLWKSFVDSGQLENSLLNLCINARDAMPHGGRLTIETANRWIDGPAAREHDLAIGQYVSLCVTDTGTGMPADVIAHAFDPFFTTKPLGQGTGLGLSMVYGFAKQSGGQVRIYSEMGKGTTVCIYLPRHVGESEEDGTEPEVRVTSFISMPGKRILVVDDESIVRMLMVDALTDIGFDALESHDGPSALRVIATENNLDLLVTDVGLPGGMNGRQVADAASTKFPNLKILFVTGYAENAVVGNGHLEPGMHILTKPFPIEELGRRIREILKSE
jgi:PAS domain S-box-containing protein